MNFRFSLRALVCSTVLVCLHAPLRVEAQAPLPLYTDRLVNAFQDWSWGTHNLANTSPTLSNVNYSVSLSGTPYNVALSLYHPDFNATVYSNLVFWGNGGTNGG